jgi:hypothetical protein
MKKSLVFVALAFLSLSVFAQQLSVGAGGSFNPYWETYKTSLGSNWAKTTVSVSMFGASAFVDATYIQASIGIGANSKTVKLSNSDSTGASSSSSSSNNDVATYLSISALGKYPIELSGFTLFPMAGVEYDLNLSLKDSNGNDSKAGLTSDEKAALNALILKAGVGADIPVATQFFVRPSLLFGYRFNSKLDNDDISAAKALGLTYTVTKLKLDIGLAIGYKL